MIRPAGAGSGTPPPGFTPLRMAALMRAAIARSGLDLSGMTVLTEAASGAYAATPVIAALAGAERVHAVGRDTAYGMVAEIRAQIAALAAAAGAGDRITVHDGDPAACAAMCAAAADLVTNSGHLRPIGARIIDRLPARSVIALMYETWEFRAADIDLAVCRRRGIPVVGVNERHPAVDVFAFLGPLAIHQLHSAGIPVYGSRILVLCDNPFAPYIARALTRLDAAVEVAADSAGLPTGEWDAVLVALRPQAGAVIDRAGAALLAERAPGAVLVQFWGDVDRPALAERGIPVWPPAAPRPGHMAVFMSDIGPDPAIRLQTGGLRAAELVWRNGPEASRPDGIAVLLTAPPEGEG